MILLVPPDFQRLQRIWFYKLLIASSPPIPTGKHILSLYVSTVDRIIILNKDLMREAIRLAARCDKCQKNTVIEALKEAIQNNIPRGRRATTATYVLQALVARMIHQSQADDRVRIGQSALKVLNFLHDWFKCQPSDQRQEQPGGAPAIIAQVLTQLGEQNAVLWTAYLSNNQAKVFDEKVKFLVIDKMGNLVVRPIHKAGAPEDPEIRNYSIEFDETQLEVKMSDGTTVPIRASRSDRVIAISPGYRFFDPPSGYVIPESIPPDIAHILAVDPQQGPSYIAGVAKDCKYWIIGGLHHVSDEYHQQSLESDLHQLQSLDVTIHVEISRPDISLWFQHVLRRYVKSVGVNVDDIERLAKAMPNTPPKVSSEFSEEYFLQLALWLACELEVDRVYVHGLGLDYVVRRDAASDDEMKQEVHADLLAKTVVSNRARGVDVVSRFDDWFGLSVHNLIAFVKVCFLRAYPVQEGWVTLAPLSTFKPILGRGWFNDSFEYQGQKIDFQVAIIPVALFQRDPGGLKFVGAGDTTSAISFVFGYHAS